MFRYLVTSFALFVAGVVSYNLFNNITNQKLLSDGEN